MTFTSSHAPEKITAVILAGGASSRMGSDKALLLWRGRAFVQHIIDQLRNRVAKIAINTNSQAPFAAFGTPLISDGANQRRGPLAGIMAALDCSETPLTLVVPCDNPMLSPQLIERLAQALENEGTDLAYAFSNGDSHYLYALMRSALRENLARFLRDDDLAVRHWYATLRVSRVDFSDQPQCFRNINNGDGFASLPPN